MKDVRVSRRFYADLGFYRVEGDDDEGWAVVTNGQLRLGLFVAAFMSENMSLNFRGGDIRTIVGDLEGKGHEFAKIKLVEGGGTASLRDPDGFLISLDTAPGETMKTDSID